MAWVVSVQLSWGDYVLSLRDLRPGDPALRIGGREFVRFVDGRPWFRAPSSDASTWQRIEQGTRHSVTLGELDGIVWAWQSSGALRALCSPPSSASARARRWGSAFIGAAVAFALSASSPLRAPQHVRDLIGQETREQRPSSSTSSTPSPYFVRFVSEPRAQLLSNASLMRCGEAEMGDPGSDSSDTRYSVVGELNNPDPHVSRKRIGTPLHNFAVGLPVPPVRPRAWPGESAALTTPWGRDSSAGMDERDAIARMWGETPDDAQGEGGTGLAQSLGGMAKGIELRAGGPAAGRRIVQAGLVVRGPRRVSEIGRALQPHFAGLRDCVERAFNVERDARLSLELRIDTHGGIELGAVESAVKLEPDLVRCLASKLEGARVDGGSERPTEVEYPILALRDSTEPTAAPHAGALREPCAASTPCGTHRAR